jgi:excisionase family DNA binding protein
MPIALSDLPMLATPKQAAEVMGLTDQQVRSLIRGGKIAHVLIGKRKMIPRDAIEKFIPQNTVHPCHAETRAPASASLKNEAATTSSGLKVVAAGSAARALQIAESLKSPLPSSSTSELATLARVIPLRSS